MQFFSAMTGNDLINIAFISWSAAQIIKTILFWLSRKKLNLERLVGSGGMPSSHSSLVVSLAIGMARIEGFSSPIFALCAAFAGVVMYDAMGVRRAAGEQAKTINNLIGSYKDFWDVLMSHPLLDFGEEEIDQTTPDQANPEEQNEHKELKEFLGHTPIEVIAGALLGILIAMVYPL